MIKKLAARRRDSVIFIYLLLQASTCVDTCRKSDVKVCPFHLFVKWLSGECLPAFGPDRSHRPGIRKARSQIASMGAKEQVGFET
jgi:hypothetical protein